MASYVLDTNVYVAADRDSEWAKGLQRFVTAFLPSIYLHGVIVQELLAGAVSRDRERLVEKSLISPFERRGRIVVPAFEAWKTAGRIVGRLVQKKHMSPGGFSRSFLNDCLLAASCLENGLTLITLNTGDFDLIRKVHTFKYTNPWPAGD